MHHDRMFHHKFSNNSRGDRWWNVNRVLFTIGFYVCDLVALEGTFVFIIDILKLLDILELYWILANVMNVFV